MVGGGERQETGGVRGRESERRSVQVPVSDANSLQVLECTCFRRQHSNFKINKCVPQARVNIVCHLSCDVNSSIGSFV